MPVLQRILLIGFFCSIFAGTFASVTVISPSMNKTEINGLLNSAGPGDTLLFRPGTYRGPFVLSGVHGSVNQPVVITGASKQKNDAAVIDKVSMQDDFTAVIDGEIYIYGNTAVSMPESEDGWTIFKISSRKAGLTKPLYIFNNSWHVDFDMIGSPRNIWKNNHIRHFNNACYSAKSDSFGIYNIGLDNHFDYDCSNVPFPGLLTGNGFEKNGLVGDPLFLDPMGNDFRLKENSPCIDRGIMDSALIMGYRGEAPDIGAYDNGEMIQGPPFQYMPPVPEVPFKEMPRITRHQTEESFIKVWFSVPLTEGSVNSTDFKIATGGKIQALNITGLSDEGYCLTLSAGQKPEAGDMELKAGGMEPEAGDMELLFSRWPEGINGMPVTSWASSVPVRLF